MATKTKAAAEDGAVAQSEGTERVRFGEGLGPLGAQATPVYGGTRMNGTVGAGCDLPYSQSCGH